MLKTSPSASTSVGNGVELRQVERFDAEPLQRAREALLDLLAVVAGLVGEDFAVAAELGGDEHAPLVLELTDAPLGLAAAIDVRRVPEIDLDAAGGLQDLVGGLVAELPKLSPSCQVPRPISETS